jgi:1,3-beta-glucanosyltransferase GAS3
MTGVLSGGIVYEYTEEPSNYGLVKINADGSLQLLKDFTTLQDQYKKLDFATVEGAKPAATTPKAPKCATSLIKEDGFNNNFTIPITPTSDDSAKILSAGVSPKPTGKLIAISDWNVKLTVKDVNGNIITGLAVKPLADDASNTPGTNTGTGTGTGSPNPSPSDKNAGSYMKPGVFAAVIVPLAAAFFV